MLASDPVVIGLQIDNSTTSLEPAYSFHPVNITVPLLSGILMLGVRQDDS